MCPARAAVTERLAAFNSGTADTERLRPANTYNKTSAKGGSGRTPTQFPRQLPAIHAAPGTITHMQCALNDRMSYKCHWTLIPARKWKVRLAGNDRAATHIIM